MVISSYATVTYEAVLLVYIWKGVRNLIISSLYSPRLPRDAKRDIWLFVMEYSGPHGVKIVATYYTDTYHANIFCISFWSITKTKQDKQTDKKER